MSFPKVGRSRQQISSTSACSASLATASDLMVPRKSNNISGFVTSTGNLYLRRKLMRHSSLSRMQTTSIRNTPRKTTFSRAMILSRCVKIRFFCNALQSRHCSLDMTTAPMEKDNLSQHPSFANRSQDSRTILKLRHLMLRQFSNRPLLK